MNDNLVDGTTVNEPVPAAETPTTARRSALAVVSLLLVVAFVAAVVGAVMWAKAAWGENPTTGEATSAGGQPEGQTAQLTAAERGRFLQDAEQAALNLTTVTPDDTDAMLANIESSSTGDLAMDLQNPELREQLAKDVKERGVTQTSRVVAISSSRFDPKAGQATALVFILQDLSSAEGQDALRRQGMSLDMKLVDGVWKVATMEQLFEGIGAAPGSGPPGQQPSASPPGEAPSGEGPPGSSPAPNAENPAGS